MIQPAIISLLIVASLSATIHNIKTTSVAQLGQGDINSINFIDDIGVGATASQIDSFKYVVAQAALLYANNIKKNIQFIKIYMNNHQGNSIYNYFVFIQQYSTTKNLFLLYAKGGNDYASFRTINPSNPTWSYLFVKTTVSPTASYQFINTVSKGSGVTSQLQTFIYNTIISNEPQGECDCEGISQIQLSMYSYDYQNWNIVCDDGYDVNAYVYPINNQWIYSKPAQCYYLLFVS